MATLIPRVDLTHRAIVLRGDSAHCSVTSPSLLGIARFKTHPIALGNLCRHLG